MRDNEGNEHNYGAIRTCPLMRAGLSRQIGAS